MNCPYSKLQGLSLELITPEFSNPGDCWLLEKYFCGS
jgi:hypothetical protein